MLLKVNARVKCRERNKGHSEHSPLSQAIEEALARYPFEPGPSATLCART
ncbi:hypothetical protein ACU4GD_24350 [Cupriavidus basilensis]